LPGVWAEIDKLAATVTGIALTPSLASIAPPQYERKKIVVGYNELLTHTGMVRQLILEGRLVHSGEQMLSEHVNRAVGVRTAAGFVLSSQKSPGLITLARCMIWAAALVARPQQKTRAAVAFSR
jgi:predicted ATP-grasp superfamily ATP-dependent carboligase